MVKEAFGKRLTVYIASSWTSWKLMSKAAEGEGAGVGAVLMGRLG